ncbi:MAG: hypothetical protein HC908_18810 [Calothrix sp. SM1_7_51]|nr:hypothetical protein [Calothrix sp. SM1_7_51]
MPKTKATKTLYDFFKTHWLIAAKALSLAFVVSALEFISAALIMPLIQVLAGTSNSLDTRTPQNLQFITNLYIDIPKNWQILAIIFSLWGLTLFKNIIRYFSWININDLQLRFGLNIRRKCVQRFLELELPFILKQV